VHLGKLRSLPEDPPADRYGLVMEIVVPAMPERSRGSA
jgi:hypothetical protein